MGLTIHAGEAIGRIIDIVRYLSRGDRCRLRRSIAHWIVGVSKGVGVRTGAGRASQAIQQRQTSGFVS